MGIDLARAVSTLTYMGRRRTLSLSTHLSLESPVSHLLASNQPPTESELPLVVQAIADAQSRLSRLDQKAQGLVEDASTSKQRKTYLDFIQAHHRTLFACRRIPTELLQEIFLYLLPQDPRTILPTRYWRASTQVCEAWRAAALSIPELWSYLPRIALSEDCARKGSYLLALRCFISLSGEAPLRLRIDAPFKEHQSGSHPVLEELVKHVERWEYLQMDSAFSTYKSCFTELGLEGKFSSLRFLDLDIWRYDSSESTFIAFQNASKLEEVSIRGMYPTGMQLPWAQLKVYREKVQNHTGLLTVINNAKALERLEVTRRTECMLNGVVELPLLKTLYMHSGSVTPADHIISHLILPSLEDLQVIDSAIELLPSLTYSFFGSLERLRSQAIFLGRAPAELQVQLKLRRLAFRTNTITPGNLIALLRLVPALEELDMPHPPTYDFQALIHYQGTNASVPLVPNLRRLYVHTHGLWGDEDTYRKIARSRCERPSTELEPDAVRVARLEAFHVVCDTPGLCRTQHAALERWFDSSLDSDPTFQALTLAKSILLYELPELVGQAPRSKKGVFTGTAPFSKRLHTVMATLEKIPLPLNIHHVYRSGTHVVLRKMVQLPDGHIPGDETYQFRQRARSILDRWRPLFVEDIKDNLRWVRMGQNSLTYVPSDHDLRKGPDAVDKLVLGLDNDRHDFHIFWHKYM